MRYLLPFFLCACLGRAKPGENTDQEPIDTGVLVETGETGETGTPPVHEWQLDAVEPPWGSNAGGDLLVLQGAGFTEDVSVQIDGKNVSISAWTESSLSITSPAYSGSGPVSVSASLGESENILEDAFTYYEDATGLAVGSGLLNVKDYIGGYWEASVTDTASGFFAFWETPKDIEIGSVMWGITEGCEVDPVQVFPDTKDVESEKINLINGSLQFELPKDETGLYWNADISLDQIEPDQPYGAESFIGPLGFDVSSPTFLKTASPFTIEYPALDGESVPLTRQNELKYGWSGSTGQWMFASFSLACADDMGDLRVIQEVTCAKADSTGAGRFEVDGTFFSKWRKNCLLYAVLSSVNPLPDEGPLVLRQNRGEMRMSAAYSIYGVSLTQ